MTAVGSPPASSQVDGTRAVARGGTGPIHLSPADQTTAQDAPFSVNDVGSAVLPV